MLCVDRTIEILESSCDNIGFLGMLQWLAVDLSDSFQYGLSHLGGPFFFMLQFAS